MGQKQKLFEDTANVLDWMSPENFREFVSKLVSEHPDVIKRLKHEIERAEKKQLTKR